MTPAEILLAAEARARAARVANGLPEDGPPHVAPLRQLAERAPNGTVDGNLKPRQALCLSLRYQFRVKQQEIGDILDVTVERARQIEHTGLRAMSVEQVRALARTVPADMVPKLLAKAAEVAPGKWRHKEIG